MDFIMAIILLIIAVLIMFFYCSCVISGRASDLEENEAADRGDSLKG